MALCKTAQGWKDDSQAACLSWTEDGGGGGKGGGGGGGGGEGRLPTAGENAQAALAREQRRAKFNEQMEINDLKQSALPDPNNPGQGRGILPANPDYLKEYAKGGPVKDPRATRRNYAKGGPIF